uniref:NADP-dependent oxidoreductase domain-containing protein n=1 Tax=Craspedostauros australis TaxID=1486917 RepID=A0A7R9ZQV4_9STRA|mmetsp:Transcript_6302/g.17126  ORF Transcript_6302/g.17126 Transcript_6302/m.17126 type:complete len:433 (+) Transcript_6302:83-1381(+)
MFRPSMLIPVRRRLWSKAALVASTCLILPSRSHIPGSTLRWCAAASGSHHGDEPSDGSAEGTCTTLESNQYIAGGAATASNCNSDSMLQHYPVGLGTYGLPPDQAVGAIQSAISVGYRRIDCAPVYFNEDKIGDAFQQILTSSASSPHATSMSTSISTTAHANTNSNTKKDSENSIDREDLYVVSKLASPFHRKEHVELALRKTLNDLRLEYLDLFLIHWPPAFEYVDIDLTQRGYANEDIDDSDDGRKIDATVSIHETWHAMEQLVHRGLVKQIGVSNFSVSLLHELMTRCIIPPAVNQVEAHPYLQQTKLLRYCQKRGVHFQAYSPLGTPGFKESEEPMVLHDPVLRSIAASHNASAAVVCLAWAIQRGTSVVVKSASAQRQAENLSVANADTSIRLTDAEIGRISKLDRGYRFFRPEDWWGELGMAVFD